MQHPVVQGSARDVASWCSELGHGQFAAGIDEGLLVMRPTPLMVLT
jgi:hypothetical protein